MPQYRNAALDALRQGQAALGLIVRINRAGDIAYAARACDHDFLFIDMQHGGISVETAVDISLAAIGAGIAPLVRVPGCSNPEAARLLDAGAMGIVVPGVASAEEARLAVQNCKFPPYGRRSVAGGYPHLGFGAVHIAEATKFLNENTAVVCMIETREGMENLEEIAAVEGVDVLHLGANDLLTEIGLPGEFGHPEVEAVIDRLIAACKANGKYAGLGGDKDPERQAAFVRKGGRFVTTHSDLGYLMGAASQRTALLRKAQIGAAAA